MRNIATKILILIYLFISVTGFSQNKEYNPIETAVPSLTIAPDARSGGMGDVGAATTPDAYSQYWNPAKYAFATSKASLALSYTPWMRSVVNGISLLNAVGYYKPGTENNQALSASLRYFSIGDVYLADAQGEFISTVAPSELAEDIGYSR